MQITHKYQTIGRDCWYYAVGDRALVKHATERTFIDLNWRAKWNPHEELIHYPGGWLDRAESAYTQACNLAPTVYSPDLITVAFYITNNAVVTLLKTSVQLKLGWLNKKKQHTRLSTFYDALFYQLRKLEIRLVGIDDWPRTISKSPELRCSPVWDARHVKPVPAT